MALIPRRIGSSVITMVSRTRPFIVAVVLLLISAVSGETAGTNAASPQQAPAPATPRAIPLADVASRATEIDALLRSYRTLQASTPVTALIKKQLPDASDLIGRELERTQRILRQPTTLETLETMRLTWEQRHQLTTTWLQPITRRATHLQDALTRLADLRETWTLTQDAARAAKAPEPVLAQIAGVLMAMEVSQATLQAEGAATLELQTRIAGEVARCQTALAQIADAETQAMGGLLERTAPPIWSREWWTRPPMTAPVNVRGTPMEWWREVARSLFDPANGLKAHVWIFVMFAAVLWAARRWTQRSTDVGASLATAVFERPISAALVISVVSHPLLFGVAPAELQWVFQVVMLVPTILLTRPLVDARVVPGLFMLAALFIVDIIRKALDTQPIEPAILSFEMVAGLLGLAYMLTIGSLRRPPAGEIESERLHVFRVVGVLLLILFATGLGCTVLGYVRLGRLIASGVLVSIFRGLFIIPTIGVIIGLVALALRIWPIRLLRMIQHHRDLLERRTLRVLSWLVVGFWLVHSLDYVGLWGPVRTLGQSLLDAKIERGALSISVEDVLAFVLTLWAAYLVSAFVRFALEEDVYPRARLPRGASYALSSVLNYVLLTVGVLAGLAVLGLDLTS